MKLKLVNRKKVYITLLLLSLSSIMSFGAFFDVEKAMFFKQISLLLYPLLIIFSIFFILSKGNKVNFNNTFIHFVLLFLAYLIIRGLLSNSIDTYRLIVNCVWPILTLAGFLIGFQNFTHQKLNLISLFLFTIVIPSFIYILTNIRYISSNQELFQTNDAFFIPIMYFPLSFLVQNKLKKYLLLSFFLFIGIISLKRSLFILISISFISYMLFLLFSKKSINNSNLFIKMSNLFVFIIFIYFILSMDVGFTDFLFDRLLNIKEDGGSGRNNLYSVILEDMNTFNLSEILFGKGLFATFYLLGVPAHNDFLDIAYSLGFIAIIIYVLIHIAIIFKIIHYIKHNGINDIAFSAIIMYFTVFISSTFNCFITNPPFISLSMFIMSMLIGAMERLK